MIMRVRVISMVFIIFLFWMMPVLSENAEQVNDNSGYNQYVDLGGNPFDEGENNIQGWGDAQVPPANSLKSPSGDNTKRYMVLRGDSSVEFSIKKNCVPYTLIFEVEDGDCDDTFWVLVNGMEIYYYSSQHKGSVILHKVEIPAEFIKDTTLKVTFRNAANDGCGLAAVYNVRLVEGGLKESRAPLKGAASLSSLGAFDVTAYNIANEEDHPCQDQDKIIANGLDNYYCSDFLQDIIMQGSGVDNNHRFIQPNWLMGNPSNPADTYFTYVDSPRTSSGNILEDDISIAVDSSIINPPGSWVYIENTGWRRADDSGGRINGYRIDLFMLVPRQEALAFGHRNLKAWALQPSELLPNTWRPVPEAATPIFNPQTLLAVSSESSQSLVPGSLASSADWTKASCIEIQTSPAAAMGIAFSPDGRTLASGGSDGAVRLWDTATGSEVKTLGTHPGMFNSVESVAFRPDGQNVASGSEDSTIRLWDVASGSEIRILTGHSSGLFSVAFSPDGRTLASGSSDKTAKMWDIDSGSEIRTLSGHSSQVWGVAFSPDGQNLASGSADGTIKLWDTASGSEIRTLTGHRDCIQGIAFSSDGHTLASASYDYTIKLWDVASGSEIRTLVGHSHVVNSVAFSPDGSTLASGSSDNTVKLWDTASGSVIQTFTRPMDLVFGVAFSPDGRTVAAGCRDNRIYLWKVT